TRPPPPPAAPHLTKTACALVRERFALDEWSSTDSHRGKGERADREGGRVDCDRTARPDQVDENASQRSTRDRRDAPRRPEQAVGTLKLLRRQRLRDETRRSRLEERHR